MAVYIAHSCALLIAAIAAVTDWRTGHIPNWLTLPPIVVAPIAWGVSYGLAPALESLLGILICGLVPYLLFRKGAMAGGDVKLFAALGGLTGIFVGVEAQFFSFLAAAILALGQLAWKGLLFKTLANAGRIAFNPLLPEKYRRAVSTENLNEFRLGAAIFTGTIVALALRHPTLWMAGT